MHVFDLLLHWDAMFYVLQVFNLNEQYFLMIKKPFISYFVKKKMLIGQLTL